MGIFFKAAAGLDISDLTIQLIQLNSKKGASSTNYISIDLGIVENGRILNQDALVKAIGKAWSTARPRRPDTKNIVASLPDSQLFTHICEFSEPEKSKTFEANLQTVVRENIPLDLADLYADYQIFNAGTAKQTVLFVGAPKALVDDYVKAIEAAGLKPLALDMESGCLGRCLAKQDFSTGDVIIVDIGARSSIISIFTSEGLYFSMNVPVAGNEFSKKISAELGVKFADAEKLKITHGVAEKNDRYGVGKIIKAELEPVVDGIRQASQYHAHKFGSEIKRVLLAGGTSAMVGLPDYLKTETKMEILVGNRPDHPMSTAYGLALRGIAKNPRVSGINILPQ